MFLSGLLFLSCTTAGRTGRTILVGELFLAGFNVFNDAASCTSLVQDTPVVLGEKFDGGSGYAQFITQVT